VLLRHARASLALTAVAVAAMVVTLAPAPPAHAAAFDDTAGTHFDEAVQALVDEGAIHGCEPDRFCPADSITRAQLASMLVRALGLPPTDVQHFDDADTSTHADNINALAEAGITNGFGDGNFRPNTSISRAEMASMLARAFEPSSAGERYFDDTGGTHASAIDDLAAAGITAGCGRPATAFCPQENVQRQQAALFLARAKDLVAREQVSSLDERRAEVRQASQDRQREQMWDDLAQCESGGNWSINTGNGYYGGLQFALSSWQAVGGSGYPHQHSREEQIHRAERLLERQGWGAWPACSSRLGYR
jgi:hypothetical protein